MKNTLILIILDGWGVGESNESNPIYMAKTPNIDFIEKNFPSGSLKSSGVAIGLPWASPGTSEIGHLVIGVGRSVSKEESEGKKEISPNLGEVITNSGKNQMRIAETKKYKSLTFYLNGLREEPYKDEYRILVPSKKTLNVAEDPEMMAKTITERALLALNEGSFDFIAINYANPDVIVSTGNYEATIRAIEIVDDEIGRILKSVLREGHTLVIVGSHGNAEILLRPNRGGSNKNNSPNPVPIYLVKNNLKRPPTQKGVKLLSLGFLSDVTPTILELMNIEKPKEMTGESLVNELV